MDYAHLQRHVLSPIVKVKMCVCVCAAMLLCMTHPNWKGVCSAVDFSPAVSACLKWWTREGINSRTALLLLPLCLTSFCLPHLFVLVSVCMFPHVRLNSRTFTSWPCVWGKFTIEKQHNGIETTHCFYPSCARTCSQTRMHSYAESPLTRYMSALPQFGSCWSCC